jgi:hypothetical protein
MKPFLIILVIILSLFGLAYFLENYLEDK